MQQESRQKAWLLVLLLVLQNPRLLRGRSARTRHQPRREHDPPHQAGHEKLDVLRQPRSRNKQRPHLHPAGQLPRPGTRSRGIPRRSPQAATAQCHPRAIRRTDPRPHRRRAQSRSRSRASRLTARAPISPPEQRQGDEFKTLTLHLHCPSIK